MQQEIWFNKYRIVKVLGRGGTATVYLAEHIRLNTYRAIKCIKKNSPYYEQQLKEAQILKILKHSCIPTIYDIEEDQFGSYIVEQYLEGDTLKELVGREGRIEEDNIIHFALLISDLILYLHSIDPPILYLDLKPENIIVIDGTLKLVDFGSAVYRDEIRENHAYYGTRGYAAPEMYGHGIIDERSDVYGIGMLMYYMATGCPAKKMTLAFDNIDMTGSCSKGLKKIINRCLKINPSQRYASVTHLIRQLSACRIKHKRSTGPDKSIRVAVAGAQPRIGVTHLSFRLCCYFKNRKVKCIYREQNDSRCIRLMKNRFAGLSGRDDIFQRNGILMLRQDQSEPDELSGYRAIIDDYGCLSDENVKAFMEADLKILVLGAKDWELHSAERVLNMTAEYEDIVYLFNFLDGRQFKNAVKSMDHRMCYRIPYEPDPFAGFNETGSMDLFHELLRKALNEPDIGKVGENEEKTDAVR